MQIGPHVAATTRSSSTARSCARTPRRRAEIVSPRTEEVIGRVPLATPADVDRAVAAARRAFDHGEWPRISPAERAAAMRRLADCLDRRQQELVELGVDENGYPIAFSEAYMAAMPSINFRMYADIAETLPVRGGARRPGGALAGAARAGRRRGR